MKTNHPKVFAGRISRGRADEVWFLFREFAETLGSKNMIGMTFRKFNQGPISPNSCRAEWGS